METFASRHLRDEAADVTDLDEPTNPLSDNERRRVYRARTLQDVDGKEGDSSAETTAKVSSSIIARQQAKITSAFEKNTPDFTNALVVAGYERHRVAEAVRHASEVQLPASRLIFVCPVSLGTTSQFSTSVRLHDICGRSIVAALQRTEDVDFHFRVPYHSEADSSSRGDLKVLEGRIFYHPSSDDCVLHNLSDTIYYASKHDRTQRHRLGKGSNTVLQPADVLILPRRFCVVRTTRTTDHAKRAYVEQPENNVLHKRPKVHPAAQAMLERSIASSAIPVLERVTVAPNLDARDNYIKEATTPALAYLKREGITHNDIKPLNIAYSPARGAVLLDFGMASMDADEDIGGTPPYMPPEYASGRLRGHLGDVWAAGVTLLIVLRKLKQPVRADYFDLEDVHNEGSEHRSIMNNWLERVAQAKATLDLNEDGIESLVEKMLHEDRSKRISAEQVQKRLLLPDNK
ncbi:hypothetical protein MY5147_000112 [Beauveria neobassiana]